MSIRRAAPSAARRRLLVEEGGFIYDSDAFNDDLTVFRKGRRVVIGRLPRFLIGVSEIILDCLSGLFRHLEADRLTRLLGVRLPDLLHDHGEQRLRPSA